jgi:uncharacterized protein (TIGR00290 family)
MRMKEPIVVSWSGGKDSALALYEILRSDQFEVLALLTTVTDVYDQISMHGVPRVLLEAQAASLGLHLEIMRIAKGAPNTEYEACLLEMLSTYKQRGVSRVSFGDLFLEDIRQYRESVLGRIGMRGLYPLWHRDTAQLAQQLITLGFRTVVTCVDPKVMSASFAGKEIDRAFLSSLPPGVDPCGENGEFHTFVFDGPIFREPVRFAVGKVESRDSFYFCNLVPPQNPTTKTPRHEASL